MLCTERHCDDVHVTIHLVCHPEKDPSSGGEHHDEVVVPLRTNVTVVDILLRLDKR